MAARARRRGAVAAVRRHACVEAVPRRGCRRPRGRHAGPARGASQRICLPVAWVDGSRWRCEDRMLKIE
eukprot:1688231-Pyramimonas_sp.AAC.1